MHQQTPSSYSFESCVTQAHLPLLQVRTSEQSSSVLHVDPAQCPAQSQVGLEGGGGGLSGGCGLGGRGTAATANRRNERVAQASDTVVELGEALGVPNGTVGAGDSLGPGESNVQDVVLVMPVVTVHAGSEARSSKGDGGLANHWVVSIVAVLVTPDSIVHLTIATYDGHDTQGFDSVGGGIKVRPVATFASDIAKHNVWVDISVEVVDALLVARDRILEGRDVLGVAAGTTSAIIANTPLSTVTVDVHVDELAAGALEVDDAVAGEMVTAVGEGVGATISAVEARSQYIVALALCLDTVIQILNVGGNA